MAGTLIEHEPVLGHRLKLGTGRQHIRAPVMKFPLQFRPTPAPALLLLSKSWGWGEADRARFRPWIGPCGRSGPAPSARTRVSTSQGTHDDVSVRRQVADLRMKHLEADSGDRDAYRELRRNPEELLHHAHHGHLRVRDHPAPADRRAASPAADRCLRHTGMRNSSASSGGSAGCSTLSSVQDLGGGAKLRDQPAGRAARRLLEHAG